MLLPDQPLAIFLEGKLGHPTGKMGYGILRYSPNPVTCVIDSTHAGKSTADVVDLPRACPVVATVQDARALGAHVLVLGLAPSGGLLPPEWLAQLDQAVQLGMCIVNGLHDPLQPRYSGLASGQWIWDIRAEPSGLGIAKGRARELPNKRLLMLGTDMAIGKMSAGLEIWREARSRGVRAEFLATGQIGIVITGKGLPLDAVRLDYACGAVEQLVLSAADSELAIVEGQGSILHPGSTATMPLIRGACPTHLVICHRAGQQTLRDFPWIRVPPLRACATLYEDIAQVCGCFQRPTTVGICLNTSAFAEEEARQILRDIEGREGLLTTDPIRFGARELVDRII